MRKIDVLIIGGGLAGCATAYYLSRAGAEVLLVERSDLNTQASGSNAGSIHAQIPHLTFVEEGDDWARTFAPTIRLLLESVRVWAKVGEELGADLEVATPGGLLVAESDAQMRDVERKAAIERSQGMQIHMLNRADLARIAPYVSERMIGGAFCADEGKANPLKATPAFANAAIRHGAIVNTFTDVVAISAENSGYRVDTNRGTLKARRVVNCAGAQSGRIAKLLGIDLPIEGHAIQISVTEPAESIITHLLYYAGSRLTLKQTAVGTCLVGGGWPARRSLVSDSLTVDPVSLQRNLQVAVRVVPALASLHLVRTWPAIVNGTADWKPILGEIPGYPGFFMNMFPWLGFSAGPIAARIVSDLVLGRTPPFDLDAFSAVRYSR
jgi:sarcosine oxidase, subunit beta